jgi:hypothetical protein
MKYLHKGQLLDRPALIMANITNIELDGVDRFDMPDFADAYFSGATWRNGRALNEAELGELNEKFKCELNDLAFQSLI